MIEGPNLPPGSENGARPQGLPRNLGDLSSSVRRSAGTREGRLIKPPDLPALYVQGAGGEALDVASAVTPSRGE